MVSNTRGGFEGFQEDSIVARARPCRSTDRPCSGLHSSCEQLHLARWLPRAWPSGLTICASAARHWTPRSWGGSGRCPLARSDTRQPAIYPPAAYSSAPMKWSET